MNEETKPRLEDGLPVLLSVVTQRWEEAQIPLSLFVDSIDRVLRDKSTECAKRAMREYTETFTRPWDYYDSIMTATMQEIVNNIEERGWTVRYHFLEKSNKTTLIEWQYQGCTSIERTLDEWSDVLDCNLEDYIEYVTFDQAIVGWKESLNNG